MSKIPKLTPQLSTSMPEPSRQLAAIMFTDIVGYTALMGEDEERAFELLKKNRQVQRPIIERFNGRWLKEIGDGVLASFTTVTDAVYCAKAIQEACLNEDDLKLRIGIHQGEVVFEGDDVFGDGVNIASRLEPLAPIGGILVSESKTMVIVSSTEYMSSRSSGSSAITAIIIGASVAYAYYMTDDGDIISTAITEIASIPSCSFVVEL